jgi:3-hydroxyisobutyrate dehydrogenase-like beta-hydroxyacid dehydrogenase
MISGNEKIKIGFIGFGEAATSICSGLKETGFGELFAYHYRSRDSSSAVSRKARGLGVQLVESAEELAKRCPIIINVTKSKAAQETAAEIFPFLNAAHIYADLNSCHPSLKKELASVFVQKEIPFIDGAIMAPVPFTKHRVPILASGSGAHALGNALKPLGMRVEVIDGPVGAASSVKMVRSLFMKGFAAVCLETFLAAKLSDEAFEKVIDSLKETFSMPFDVMFERFLTGTIHHAKRRVQEMEDAVSFASELGMEPIMSKATCELLRTISNTNEALGKDGMHRHDDAIFSLLREAYRHPVKFSNGG